MNSECIFCKICSGELPAKEIHRDDDVIAIADINPQAPQHYVVMPKEHFRDMAALHESGNGRLAARMLAVATQIGREHGARGFRIVGNNGPDGGQTVDHVHLHVLAGRRMTWPPG
jgi:histidine triad (HIT) family protein